MANSARGPQRRPEGPYVAHLDKVCRLLEDGQRLTVEFHPYGDLPGDLRDKAIRGMELHIMDGGDVAFRMPGSSNRIFLGMTLGNYGRLWRVWIGGTPNDAQRRAMRWR